MKAIIIGGGIGGLTTAIALEHFGIRSSVYEAAPALKEVGAGLWIAPNAMAVFDQLGLSKPILTHGASYEDHIGVATASGKLLTRIDCQAVKSKFGHTTTAIHRARLHELLASRAPAVIPDKRFVRYEEDGNEVVAHFEDGTTAAGDVLIAADGVRSRTRTQMFGEVPYRYTGQTCWRLVCDHELSGGISGMVEYWGDRAGLRAAYGPLGHGQIYMYVTDAAPRNEAHDPATVKQRLLEAVAGFPPAVAEIVGHTAVERIIRNDLYDFAPLHDWCSGTVALVGDAAHATTPNLGQGACQAIESAYVVARSLARHDAVQEAFAAYQQARMPKAHYVTNTSWTMGQSVNLDNALARGLRNFMVSLTPEFVRNRMQQRLYGFAP